MQRGLLAFAMVNCHQTPTSASLWGYHKVPKAAKNMFRTGQHKKKQKLQAHIPHC